MIVTGILFDRTLCPFPYGCGETWCDCDPEDVEIALKDADLVTAYGIDSGKTTAIVVKVKDN